MATLAIARTLAPLLAVAFCSEASAQVTRAGVRSAGTCIRALVFSPDGAGGYVVSYGEGLFDPAPGASLGLADDNVLGAPVDLGFAFPFPGGQVAQRVVVDVNGRILIEGTETASDPTPTRAELLGEPWPVIACWSDFNPRGGGAIAFAATLGASATFTWRDVPQFGSTMGQSFQIQLFVNGTIVITFADLSGFNLETFRTDDLLIGVSAGNGAADPSEADFSSGLVHTPAVPDVYELFDRTSERFDLQTNPKLATLTFPHIGSAWHMRLVNAPPGAGIAAFVVGFARIDIDLSPLGLPPGCALLTLPQVTVPRTVDARGTATTVFAIPSTSAYGLEVFVQGLTDGGANPALPLALSGRLEGTLGT